LARQNSHFQISTATSAFAQAGEGLVGEVQNLCARVRDGRARRRSVGHLAQLDLCGHDGLVRIGGKTAALAHHARGVRGRRDNRRFLDGHGDQAIDAVDEEIEAKAERHGIDANGVFDHAIGALYGQSTRREKGQVFR
jgi:hypothetical protein